MAQALLAYGLVSLAAGWTVWSVFLPPAFRSALARHRAKPRRQGCGDGCNCG